MQAEMHDTFDAAGLTLERCAEIMAEIMSNPRAGASDRLKAIDMRMRLTVGYAPTKSANMQLHGRMDNFYDKSEFDKNPGITIDQNDEKNDVGGK